MRILKLFNKFFTNHSSSAYQILVIGVRKGTNIEDKFDKFKFLDLAKIESLEEITRLENDYDIELEHLTDEYYIFESYISSTDSHSYYEDYEDGDEEWEDYVEKWEDSASREANNIKKHSKEDLIVLFFDEDID